MRAGSGGFIGIYNPSAEKGSRSARGAAPRSGRAVPALLWPRDSWRAGGLFNLKAWSKRGITAHEPSRALEFAHYQNLMAIHILLALAQSLTSQASPPILPHHLPCFCTTESSIIST